MSDSRPLIHVDDLEFPRDLKHDDRFEARLAPVGRRIGARKLGYNVTVVPPGKRAFPFHNHHANEEMFFVLDGEGTLRFGKKFGCMGGLQSGVWPPTATFPARFVLESAGVDYWQGE